MAHRPWSGSSWATASSAAASEPVIRNERAFLEAISPHHRFEPETNYTAPFFVTSTKDDRVHPAHARKMAKRFEEANKPFFYFENIDGGHGAATTQIERAKRAALEFTYLNKMLTD